jgi:hypothetical protein
MLQKRRLQTSISSASAHERSKVYNNAAAVVTDASAGNPASLSYLTQRCGYIAGVHTTTTCSSCCTSSSSSSTAANASASTSRSCSTVQGTCCIRIETHLACHLFKYTLYKAAGWKHSHSKQSACVSVRSTAMVSVQSVRQHQKVRTWKILLVCRCVASVLLCDSWHRALHMALLFGTQKLKKR